MKLFKFINRPHPFIFNTFSFLVPGVVTFLILFILAPLQFQELDILSRLIIALLVSLFVVLSILFSVLGLKRLFPKLMQEDKWTVGKEVVLILFVLCILIITLTASLFFIQSESTTIGDFLIKTTSITFAVSIFPILISVLFEQYRHQKLQIKRAADLTSALKKENSELKNQTSQTTLTREKLLIRSENNDVEIQLNPQDLVYLKSDGNYVDLFYLDSNSLKKQLIRNTLKNIEAELPSAQFFRCHNSFIINGHHILKVEGNARNLMLHLKEVSETIPVSRTKAKTISGFLERLS